MFSHDLFGPKKGGPFQDLFFEEFHKSGGPLPSSVKFRITADGVQRITASGVKRITADSIYP